MLYIGSHYGCLIFSGHEVVRLPVAHCTLNPIELAWAQVKGHVKENAKLFNLSEVERLAWEGFVKVTGESWAKLIRHVQEKIEDHYWSCDGLYRQHVQLFIIQFGGSSDSDTASSEESDSEQCASDVEFSNDSVSHVCSCED